MKYPFLTVLLLLSLLLNAIFYFQSNPFSGYADSVSHLEQMLAESAQLIMYDMDEEQIIRLDQSLELIVISADELKDSHTQADIILRKSLSLIDLLFEEEDAEPLIKRVRGEIRQEMSLIIQESLEQNETDQIELRLRNLLEEETTFKD